MASFICCGSRRGSSPDPGPARLVDNTQTRGRFVLSTDVSPASSTNTGEVERSVHHIFQEASGGKTKVRFLRGHGSVKRTNRYGLERKESRKRIQSVANRVRKSMSRDSGFSKHGPNHTASDPSSHEDKQLRQLSIDRLQAKSHRSDLNGSDYDEDAITMKTPKSTWGREQEHFVEANPRTLTTALNDLPPPRTTSQHERTRQNISEQPFVQESATAALSRILTTRSRSMQASSHDAARKEGAEELQPNRSTSAKYIFRDESPERPSTRTPSPLGRSDTVIRTPSSTAVVDLGQPTFLNSVRPQSIPNPPNLLPQRMASIGNSLAGREWRLSLSQSSHGPAQLGIADRETPEDIDLAEENIVRYVNVTPESWTRGGPFRAPIHQMQIPDDTAREDTVGEKTSHGAARSHDSATAEGPARVQPSDERKQSSGSDSIHLYSMRIPYQLASQTLLSLQESSQSDSHHLVEDDLTNRNVKDPNFRPDPHSNEVPLSWNLPKKYAASSVYSHDSVHATPSQSNKSSLMFLNKIADRMNRLGPDAPAQDIISVPAMSNKVVNLTQLEDVTRETSFHSSNESLTNREIAASESRIIPRAKTLKQPKNSWFKEDFDEVAAALLKTNPQRRAVSQRLQSKPSLSSYDGSMERHLSIQPRSDRFSIVAGGRKDTGAFLWGKALREHDEEDKVISRTRVGSDAKFSDRNSFRHRHHQLLDPRKPPPHRHIIDRFSADHKEGEFIKARLDAFQLPTPPRPLPPSDDPRKQSSPNSFPSWKCYPSHNRHQRSSASAGSADNVLIRDFAEEAASIARLARLANDKSNTIDPTARLLPQQEGAAGSKETTSLKASRKSKSMTFGDHALSKLQELYRASSLELASKTAFGSRGHRSSISEGWATEYPELEMLPPGSPTLSSFDGADFGPVRGRKHRLRDREDLNLLEGFEGLDYVDDGKKKDRRMSSRPGANTWSRMYVEECVALPPISPPESQALPVDDLQPDCGREEECLPYPLDSQPRVMIMKEQRGLGSDEQCYRMEYSNISPSTADIELSLPATGEHEAGGETLPWLVPDDNEGEGVDHRSIYEDAVAFSPESGLSEGDTGVVSDGIGSGSGSWSEGCMMRESTLDFKRSLEVLERREREKVLGLGISTA